jgi:hypothetical protein
MVDAQESPLLPFNGGQWDEDSEIAVGTEALSLLIRCDVSQISRIIGTIL